MALYPRQLKTLNSQIALLIEYKQGCDSIIRQCDNIVTNLKANNKDLGIIINNQLMMIENKDKEIQNQKDITRNKVKMGRRRMFGGIAGGIVIGIIIGLIIK